MCSLQCTCVRSPRTGAHCTHAHICGVKETLCCCHTNSCSLSLSLSHSTIHSASPFILPHRCVLRVQQSPSPPDSTCQPFNPFLTLLMNLFRIECLNFYLVPCRAVRVCPQLGFVGDAVWCTQGTVVWTATLSSRELSPGGRRERAALHGACF